MKLGVEVGLGPGRIVLDEDPGISPSKGHSPNFWPMSIVPKRLDGSRCHLVWNGGRPRPKRHSVKWGPSAPSL